VDIVLAAEVVRVLGFITDTLYLDGGVVEVELSAAHVGDGGERLKRL
jgi:hypothetical protein